MPMHEISDAGGNPDRKLHNNGIRKIQVFIHVPGVEIRPILCNEGANNKTCGPDNNIHKTKLIMINKELKLLSVSQNTFL